MSMALQPSELVPFVPQIGDLVAAQVRFGLGFRWCDSVDFSQLHPFSTSCAGKA